MYSYAYYLECNDGFMGIYIYQNLNSTLFKYTPFIVGHV